MDTQARIEAAKARLEQQRSVLVKAKEAGPPCTRCSHFNDRRPENVHISRWTPQCLHPSFAKYDFDPVLGKVSESAAMSAMDARKIDGPCGPEGALFDSDWKRAPNLGDKAKSVGYGVFGVLAFAGLLEFLSLFGLQ